MSAQIADLRLHALMFVPVHLCLRPYVLRRNGTGQNFFDPTGKFQNLRRFLTGPVDRFFIEGFCSLFNVYNENFSKGGACVRC